MAGEEDVELRDLVAQTLEAKGVLGKIRAQLRASVFLALEEQETNQKPHPLANSKLTQYLKTKEGQTTTALVREFLEFFELDYTCSVFDPESNALETYPGREKLARELGLEPLTVSSGPLLAGVLQKASNQSVTRQLKFPEPSELAQPETGRIETSGASTSAIATTTSATIESTHIFAHSTTTTGGYPSMGLSTHEHKTDFQTFKVSQANDIFHKGGSSTHSSTIGLNTNENSNLTSGLEPRLTSPVEVKTTHDEDQLHSPLGTDLEQPGISLAPLQDQNVRAELGETFLNSTNSSLDVDKLLNTSGDVEKLDKLLKSSAVSDELNDFFESSVKGEGEISEHLEDNSLLSGRASDKFETEDHTLSDNSLAAGFDHTEHVHS